MANIKQKSTLTPTLDTILYIVNGTTDGNCKLQAVKTSFGIEDVEAWQTESITYGTTGYISLESSATYGAIEIDYLAKRSGRGYRTGKITMLVDSIGSAVIVSDSYIATSDDLGLVMDYGRLSSGVIQLDVTVDSSDTNPVVLNYQIISKRPISVS